MDSTYLYFVKLIKKLNCACRDYCFNYDNFMQTIDVINNKEELVDTIVFRDNNFRYKHLLDIDGGLKIIDIIRNFLNDNPYDFE